MGKAKEKTGHLAVSRGAGVQDEMHKRGTSWKKLS